MSPLLFWLLFEVKHFLADFPLQTDYMLGKFKPGNDYIKPLATHCAVHAVLTLVILLVLAPHFWYLTFLDFVVHFIMDRIKASPALLGRFSALSKKEYAVAYQGSKEQNCLCCTRELNNNKYFWWALGLDQMVHNMTYLSIVYIITRGH